MMTGKSTKGRPGSTAAAVADSASAAGHLRRIVAASRGVEAARKELLDAVAAARDADVSWEAIGAALGITKQGAFQRFAKDVRRAGRP
jgi:hypothetical protein